MKYAVCKFFLDNSVWNKSGFLRIMQIRQTLWKPFWILEYNRQQKKGKDGKALKVIL